MNIVLHRIETLSNNNYILNPSSDNQYWVNITSSRVKEYLDRCGEAFNIVIVGSEADEGDFYAIPYTVLKPVLVEQFLTRGKQTRWVVSIPNHQFKVRNCPIPLDVGAFYGNLTALTNPGQADSAFAADANDYAIENRKVEVERRLKQSVFRKRIMQNFERRCCLSGISEAELLVASHIVPWCKRIDTRLNPSQWITSLLPLRPAV